MAPSSLLAVLTFRRPEPAFLPTPPSNGAVSSAARTLQHWLRERGSTAFFILVMASAAVGGASWFAAQPDQARAQIRPCDDGTFRQAKVTTRIQIDVAGLAYPRITSDLEVSVPRGTDGADLLLASPSSDTGRAALACLLGDDRSPLEVRKSPQKVAMRDGSAVVTQHSYADVVNAGEVWADLARIRVRSNDQPWLLTVHSSRGLRYATWDVTLVAPEGWLSDPWPSKLVEAGHTQLRWPPAPPMASRDGNIEKSLSYVVAGARLAPDTRSAFAAAAADRRYKPFAWGLYWLSALVFACYVTLVLRNLRGRRRSPADRAARYLILMVVLAGTQAVLDAVSPPAPLFWPYFGWAADGVLLAVTALGALHWQAPRVAVQVVYAVGLGSWLIAFPRPASDGRWWIGTANVVLSFAVTLLLMVWVGKSLLELLWEERRTPRWLWCAASLSGAVLVLERLVLAYVNHERQHWLGVPRLNRDIAETFRYYPLDLLDETAWLVLLIGAAAVWRHASRSFQDNTLSPMPVAIALFAAGPMWWDVHLWGVWWPLGVVSLGLFWLLRRSSPRTTGDSPGGGSPAENMRKAIKVAKVPALIAGIGLLVTTWIVHPLISINQQDSVVLEIVDTVAWEIAKWLLAAAALGLAWQRLPGKRWPAKAMPAVLAYVVAPVGQYLVNRASNGVDNWIPLADASLFALVMLFVALRLDFALRPADEAQRDQPGRVGKFLTRIGLANVRGHLGEAAAVIMALLAIWAAITGGEVAFPSVDPGQFSRSVPAER